MLTVDGEWESWAPWTECSVSCGNGTSTRERICHQPLHGGDNCTGISKETKYCKIKECPSKYFDGVKNIT